MTKPTARYLLSAGVCFDATRLVEFEICGRRQRVARLAERTPWEAVAGIEANIATLSGIVRLMLF